MGLSLKNIGKPTTTTYNKIRRVISYTTTFICTILLMQGFAENAPAVSIIKLSQSFIMDVLGEFSGMDSTVIETSDKTIEVTPKTDEAAKSDKAE